MALKGPGLVCPGSLLRYRRIRRALAAPTLLPSIARGATAGSEWPSRPLRLVVPFAPGGGADNTALFVAQQLTEDLGQSVVVENEGGGGSPDAVAVLGAPAGGNTILYGTLGPLITNPPLLASPPCDAERELVSVSMLVRSRHVLVVHPSVPARSVAELIALPKARPSRLLQFRHSRRQPLGWRAAADRGRHRNRPHPLPRHQSFDAGRNRRPGADDDPQPGRAHPADPRRLPACARRHPWQARGGVASGGRDRQDAARL